MGNNPISGVDPDGAEYNPVYGLNSEFLGTTESGLQGEAIVMAASDFKQGMSDKLAMEKGMYFSDFVHVAYLFKFVKKNFNFSKIFYHHGSLPLRPDYDGFVTKNEGIRWALDHPNALANPTPDNTLYINSALLDFGNISVSDLANGEGEVSPVNLLNFGNMRRQIVNPTLKSTIYALGRVNLFLVHAETREVKIVNDAATDYDWNTGGSWIRNKLILNERRDKGLNDSHGFKVYYYGIGRLRY